MILKTPVGFSLPVFFVHSGAISYQAKSWGYLQILTNLKKSEP